MEKLTFKSKDANGNEIILEAILTYHDEETNKDYIIYTDNTFDKEGKLKIYYSLYQKVNNDIKLIKITSSEDKKICLMLLKNVIEEVTE